MSDSAMPRPQYPKMAAANRNIHIVGNENILRRREAIERLEVVGVAAGDGLEAEYGICH